MMASIPIPSYVHPFANNVGFAGFGSNNNTPQSGKYPAVLSRPGSAAAMPGLTAPLPVTPSNQQPPRSAGAAAPGQPASGGLLTPGGSMNPVMPQLPPNMPMPTSRECVVKVVSCVVANLFPPVYELEKSGECKYFDAHFTPSLSPQQYYARLAEYSGVSGEVLLMTLFHLHSLYPFQNMLPGQPFPQMQPYVPQPYSGRTPPSLSASMSLDPRPVQKELRTSPLRLSPLNFHRVFLAALMVSTKYFDDHFLSNASFAKLGGIAVNELNAMESAFLNLTGFSLYIAPAAYKNFYLFISSLPFHTQQQPLPGAAAAPGSPMAPLRSMMQSVSVSPGAAAAAPGNTLSPPQAMLHPPAQPSTCQCAVHIPFYVAYTSQVDAVNAHTYCPPTSCPPCVLIPLKASRFPGSQPSSPATQLRTLQNKAAQPQAPGSASRAQPGGGTLLPPIGGQPQPGGTLHVPSHLAGAKPAGASNATASASGGGSSSMQPAAMFAQQQAAAAAAAANSQPQPMQFDGPQQGAAAAAAKPGPQLGLGGAKGGGQPNPDSLARAVLMRSFMAKQTVGPTAGAGRLGLGGGTAGGSSRSASPAVSMANAGGLGSAQPSPAAMSTGSGPGSAAASPAGVAAVHAYPNATSGGTPMQTDSMASPAGMPPLMSANSSPAMPPLTGGGGSGSAANTPTSHLRRLNGSSRAAAASIAAMLTTN